MLHDTVHARVGIRVVICKLVLINNVALLVSQNL